MDNQISPNVGLEATTPGYTPPKEGNRENDLYQAWKIASPAERMDIENRLLQSLRRHASKVCWMVLHSHQPDLIDEIAQDVILDLPKFEERSSFSTWVHSRARFRCQAQFKQNRQRREVSLTTLPVHVVARESSLETKVMVDQMLSNLTPFENKLVDLKCYQGLSDAEVAPLLGYTREWITKSWLKLRKKLKEKYNA